MALDSFEYEVLQQSTTTLGTAAYNLTTAVLSYKTFRQAFVNGANKICYVVRNKDNSKWEINRFGTLTYSAPDLLSRNVIRSTSSDAPVIWTSGDWPLTIYVSPNVADVLEGSITGWLAAARNAFIRFGQWAKSATPSSRFAELTFFDGVSDTVIGYANVTDGGTVLRGIPKDGVEGLEVTRPSTTTIAVAPGAIWDSTKAVGLVLKSAITKSTAGVWAAGNNSNGMGQGLTIASNTWYHVFLIEVNGVVDVYLDTSATAANKPAGCTYFKKIMHVKTAPAATTLIDFIQMKETVLWKTSILDVNNPNWANGTAGSVTFPSVPPGFVNKAMLNGFVNSNTSAGWGLDLYCPDTTRQANDYVAVGLFADQDAISCEVHTNTSQQINNFVVCGGSLFPMIVVRGWIMDRGR